MRDEFLASCYFRPDDWQLRLSYADWLEQQMDPHADFIRLQVALGHAAATDDRYWDLATREWRMLMGLTRHLAGPMAGYGRDWQFRGGLVEDVRCTTDELALMDKRGPELGPVRRVRLTQGRIADVAGCRILKSLQGLDISQTELDTDSLRTLASLEGGQLQSLVIRNQTQLFELLREPAFRSLRHLGIHSASAINFGLLSEALPNLVSLSLIGPTSLQPIRDWEREMQASGILQRLQNLEVAHVVTLRPDLLLSTNAPRLQRLSLSHGPIGILPSAPSLRVNSLRELSIHQCQSLRGAELVHIDLSRIISLRLTGNSVPADSLRSAMLATGQLPQLRALDVRGIDVSSQTLAQALDRAGCSLRSLRLTPTDAMTPLANSEGLRHLRVLDVSGSSADHVVGAIIGSAFSQSLRVLRMAHMSRLRGDRLQKLLDTLSELEILDLRHSGIRPSRDLIRRFDWGLRWTGSARRHPMPWCSGAQAQVGLPISGAPFSSQSLMSR